jgi:hypothetical protein
VKFSKEEEEDVAKCRATIELPLNAETGRQQRKRPPSSPRTQKQIDSKGKDHQSSRERRNSQQRKHHQAAPEQKHVDSKRKTTIARCDGGIRKRDSPTAPIRATS